MLFKIWRKLLPEVKFRDFIRSCQVLGIKKEHFFIKMLKEICFAVWQLGKGGDFYHKC